MYCVCLSCLSLGAETLSTQGQRSWWPLSPVHQLRTNMVGGCISSYTASGPNTFSIVCSRSITPAFMVHCRLLHVVLWQRERCVWCYTHLTDHNYITLVRVSVCLSVCHSVCFSVSLSVCLQINAYLHCFYCFDFAWFPKRATVLFYRLICLPASYSVLIVIHM